MSKRFNTKKISVGERFKIGKSANLEHIKVRLSWKSKGDVDLDVSAFLLGEDGEILNNEDFVFYNSELRLHLEEKDEKQFFQNDELRGETFDRTLHGGKSKWKKQTRPISLDGSVLGSRDERGEVEENESSVESKECFEEMLVNLDKVDGKISEIVICATNATEGQNFGDIEEPYIAIHNEDADEELCYHDLANLYSKENAAAVASLVCDDGGEWAFIPLENKGYEGGIETLIDIYAS